MLGAIVSFTDCKGIGYLADVMNILSKRFNFTWSCDAEPFGNWGHNQQISGPRNTSGIYYVVQYNFYIHTGIGAESSAM